MDGAAAEKEGLGDLRIRHATRQQAQYLDLPLRQLIETGRRSHLRLRGVGRDFRGRSFTPGGQNSTPCASNRRTNGETPIVALLTERRSRWSRLHRQECLFCWRKLVAATLRIPPCKLAMA
jgi:hypothetical protein